MNLYLFPETPNKYNGYGIAVDQDFEKLCPCNNDIIVWYTNNLNNEKIKKSDYVIKRPQLINFKRIQNMILNRVSSELRINELSFLKNLKFDNIHCDDVVFYRAIRHYYPNQKISVRFHNCFSRIYDRKKMLDINVDYKFEINLRSMYRLEKLIFSDKNAFKIFISKEDQLYYQLTTGNSDSDIWGFEVNEFQANSKRSPLILKKRLIWLGGAEAHKAKSIKWFIDEVFPLIKINIPDVEFHLWGINTVQFSDSSRNIFGHGFYDGDDIPLKENSLFINPDIIGGGVKLKLKTYFEEGIPFITTPFGFEGYNKKLIDNKYCTVCEMHDWANRIIQMLNN